MVSSHACRAVLSRWKRCRNQMRRLLRSDCAGIVATNAAARGVRESAEQHSAETVSPPQPEAMQPQLPSHSPAPPASHWVPAERSEQHVPGTLPVFTTFATIRTEIRREIRREVPVVRPVSAGICCSASQRLRPCNRGCRFIPACRIAADVCRIAGLPNAAPTVPVAAARQTVAADRPVEASAKTHRPSRSGFGRKRSDPARDNAQNQLLLPAKPIGRSDHSSRLAASRFAPTRRNRSHNRHHHPPLPAGVDAR